MMKFITNLSIRSRIYAGFILVSSFIFIVGIIAYSGTVKIESGFNKFVEANELSKNISDLDVMVLELQQDVQNFIYTGDLTMAENVFAKLKNLNARLDGVQSADPPVIDYLSRMKERISGYQKTFTFAVEERKIRNQLVETNQSMASTLQAKLKQDSPVYVVINSTQKSLYEYLNDPDILKINSAIKKVDQVIDIDNISFKEDLVSYKKNVLDIVQSTRGYLYLLSVVMAGEAQEFTYISKKLKTYVQSTVEPVKKSHEKENKNIQKVVLLSSLLMVFIALVFSFIISTSINKPLLSLAHTFKMLAANEPVESIPGLELEDEIGHMSKAAEVFRQKNEETKQLVEELDQKKKDLETSNAELDQFVYTVSHDLKSPIVTSMGFIGMMKEFAAADQSEMAMKKIPTLEKANKKMSQLIDDLLNLSRLGRVDEETEDVKLKEVVENVVSIHEYNLDKKGIKVNIEGEFPTLMINETRISQVFENLLSNAVKYCVTDKPEITIGCKDDPGKYLFFVKDNGPGIAEEYHQKVFNLFQRLDKNTEGTGIGLAIVHRIVTSQGGNIWIESGKGIEGCTFWIEFPKNHEQRAS